MLENAVETLQETFPVEQESTRRGTWLISNTLLTPAFMPQLEETFSLMKLQIESTEILEEKRVVRITGTSDRYDELGEDEDTPEYTVSMMKENGELLAIDVKRVPAPEVVGSQDQAGWE